MARPGGHATCPGRCLLPGLGEQTPSRSLRQLSEHLGQPSCLSVCPGLCADAGALASMPTLESSVWPWRATVCTELWSPCPPPHPLWAQS